MELPQNLPKQPPDGGQAPGLQSLPATSYKDAQRAAKAHKRGGFMHPKRLPRQHLKFQGSGNRYVVLDNGAMQRIKD